MFDWNIATKPAAIRWLLEGTNPSVRYFALLDVLAKEERNPEVVAARNAISESLVAKKILQRQNPAGFWEDPASPYHPKYKSSYWQVMMLGQLGLDKSEEKIRKSCEYIFQFQSAEGGFSSFTTEAILREHVGQRQKGKRLLPSKEYSASLVHEHEYSCLTGNMATALTRLGCGRDLRVKKALEWLVQIQKKDGGWLCPYWRAHVRDKHGCFFGTICPLEAFSMVEKEMLTKEMKAAAERAAEFILTHRLFKADHHGYAVINRHWLTLTFPMFISYNILRGLDVLTKLGYVKDERLDDAVEALLRKEQADGTWILESSPAGRLQANLEPVGKPSKWITLIALRALKRLALN